MTTDKVVWEAAVEGLFVRGVGARLTPALAAELKAHGLDLTKKLPLGLPRDAWYACLKSAARHLHPELTREEAMRALGRLTVDGIAQTFWGRAFAPAVQLLGPRRLLLRVPSQMRSTNNFATGTLVELGPASLRLEVTDAGDAPEMMQGSLERLASWAGAQEVRVEVATPSPPAASYLISWRG
jgi:uncharacterized protein (TIGR02265 family)